MVYLLFFFIKKKKVIFENLVKAWWIYPAFLIFGENLLKSKFGKFTKVFFFTKTWWIISKFGNLVKACWFL